MKIGDIRARIMGRMGRRKIGFIVAGAQKCGTTAFHALLKAHPQIGLPDRQEMHFFDNDNLFAGAIDYDLLHRHFKPNKSALISGETTPIYCYWPPAMQRIHDYNPDIKIILILRNPIHRAFSHWNMQRKRNLDSRDFLEAVEQERQLAVQSLPVPTGQAYVARGLYSQQLERIFQYFPRGQVHVIRFEEWRVDPHATMERVFQFLCVDSLPRLPHRELNKIAYDREMTKREEKIVGELFAEDIPKVEALLGWDCSDWRENRIPGGADRIINHQT